MAVVVVSREKKYRCFVALCNNLTMLQTHVGDERRERGNEILHWVGRFSSVRLKRLVKRMRGETRRVTENALAPFLDTRPNCRPGLDVGDASHNLTGSPGKGEEIMHRHTDETLTEGR